MIDLDATVASLVLEHSGVATVFDRRRIDYCCEGHRPLSQVVTERAIDPAELSLEIEAVMQTPDPDADPRTAPTSALISRALARQHRHLRASLTLLQHQAAALVADHGKAFPILRTLASGIGELADHLLPQLDHEEDVLFPALIQGELTPEIRADLGKMFDEHREFGQLFRRLRSVTADYTPPAGANDSVRRLFAAAAELEGMIVRHHHVENHVLLPRFR